MTHVSSMNNVKLLAFKQFVAMVDAFVVSIYHRLLIRKEGLNVMVSNEFSKLRMIAGYYGFQSELMRDFEVMSFMTFN